jgi:polar amino acid transport system permease protein
VLVTISLTAAAVIGGLVLGMGIALMRMSTNPVSAGFARFYIWFFRGTPLLIQLVVIYTGLPQFGLKFGVITCALVGLILNEAAYLAEIVRSGFLAVPPGQREAAWALGLPKSVTLRRVPPDDPAARQLDQLAFEGDVACLRYIGRGNHAPE